MVVLRSSTFNQNGTLEDGGRLIRLRRLLSDDSTFAVCTFGMISSIATFVFLQVIQVGFFTLYGGERAMNAFNFIRFFFHILPHVLNCILLDHLPLDELEKHLHCIE
jgi:hypothetical protein